jgi:hypothetical protein
MNLILINKGAENSAQRAFFPRRQWLGGDATDGITAGLAVDGLGIVWTLQKHRAGIHKL